MGFLEEGIIARHFKFKARIRGGLSFILSIPQPQLTAKTEGPSLDYFENKRNFCFMQCPAPSPEMGGQSIIVENISIPCLELRSVDKTAEYGIPRFFETPIISPIGPGAKRYRLCWAQ